MKKIILLIILLFILCSPLEAKVVEETCWALLDRMQRELNNVNCGSSTIGENSVMCSHEPTINSYAENGSCDIKNLCHDFGVSTVCFSDQEIPYTSTATGDIGDGIKADKIKSGSCKATKTLPGTETKTGCENKSMSADNPCAYYKYIERGKDTSEEGDDEKGSYQFGGAYYLYRRAKVTKYPTLISPDGYHKCNPKIYSFEYSYALKTYDYKCSNLAYVCSPGDPFGKIIERYDGYCTETIQKEKFFVPRIQNTNCCAFNPLKKKTVGDYTWGLYSSTPTVDYTCIVKEPGEFITVDVYFGSKYNIDGHSGYCVGAYNHCSSGQKDFVLDMSFGSTAYDRALVGIVKSGSDYLSTIVALKLRASEQGVPYLIGVRPLPFVSGEKNILFTKNLLKNTIDRIKKGYDGKKVNSNYFPEIMYGGSTLSKAISLYKSAGSANNSSKPSVNLSGKSTIGDNIVDFTITDKDTIEFKTTFNSSTKIRISATNGVKIGNISRRNEGGYHYITATVVDARANEGSGGMCYNNIKDFKITITGSGSGAQTILQYVRKYVSVSRSDVFILTNNPFILNSYSKTFKINVKCENCDPTPLTTQKSADTSCNLTTGAGGKVSFTDPDEYKIIKACTAQKKPYEYRINNQYCNVYCTEKINMELMPVVSGKAGRFFKYTLGGRVNNQNINTALTTSTLTCVSEIRYNKWKVNYTAASASRKAQLLIALKNCNLYKDNGSATQSIYNTIVNDYEGNYSSKMTITYKEKGLENTPKISHTAGTTSSTDPLWCTETGNTLDNRKCITPSGFSSTQTRDGSIPTSTHAKMSTTVSVDYYQSQPYYTQAYTGATSLTPQPNYQKLEDYVYPLNLLTLSGLYDITLNYSNMGKSGRQVNNTGTYKCKYQVENEIISIPVVPGDGGTDGGDNVGLNLFFRTIDLTKIFPNDRQLGPKNNWNTEIAKNVKRDIERLGNDVWLETPKYTFTLNPENIEKIRGYNKVKENAKVGYLDMSLKCENGIAKCLSDFLTKIETEGYAVSANLYPGRE